MTEPRRGRRANGNPNGMGTVIRKVDKRGYVVFKPRVIVDGIPRWGEGVGVRAGTTEARARQEAEKNRKLLVARIARGEHVPGPERRLTTAALVERWWKEIEASAREASTKQRYGEFRGVLTEYLSLLPRQAIDLRPVHVLDLHRALRDAGRASTTVRGVHDVLLAILAWGRDTLLLPLNTSLFSKKALKRPAHTTTHTRSVSVAEALALLEAMKDDHPFGPLVAALYYAGLRDAEASALVWGDIGVDGITVERQRAKKTRAEKRPKWDSGGWVPLLPQLRAVLEDHRAWCRENGYPTGPGDWVFGHRRSGSAPIRPPLHQTTWQHIKDACARAGLSSDISAHSMRRGFSDAADEAGVTVRVLADILRNDPAVAVRYQKKDVAKMREAGKRISAAMAPKEVTAQVTATDRSAERSA